MNCSEARPRLHLLADRSLVSAQEEALWGHVRHCPACARELQQLERTFDLLYGLSPLRSQPGFVGQVATRLSHRYRRSRFGGTWYRLGLNLALALTGLAGLAMALVPLWDMVDDLSGDTAFLVMQALGDILALFSVDGYPSDPISSVQVLHEDALVATNLVGGQVLLGATLVLVVCFIFLFEALTARHSRPPGFPRTSLPSHSR